MKYLLILLSILFIWSTSSAHENEEYKHGSCPPCHGWELLDSNIRRCFLDAEHKMCVNLIYNHETWHVTEPFKCEEAP